MCLIRRNLQSPPHSISYRPQRSRLPTRLYVFQIASAPCDLGAPSSCSNVGGSSAQLHRRNLPPGLCLRPRPASTFPLRTYTLNSRHTRIKKRLIDCCSDILFPMKSSVACQSHTVFTYYFVLQILFCKPRYLPRVAPRRRASSRPPCSHSSHWRTPRCSSPTAR